MRSGFTLVEVLVVLVLMGLAAALVAPALFPSRESAPAGVAALVGAARDAAVRRGEVVYLRIGPSGEWRVEGAASAAQGDLAGGRLAGFSGPPFTLVVSPLGSCAFDVRSVAAARAIALDPLTCEVRAP